MRANIKDYIYLYTAKKLGVYPNECIIFEDILIAINTAKEANFNVIGVYDKSSYNDLHKIKVKSDKFIYDFKELLKKNIEQYLLHNINIMRTKSRVVFDYSYNS